MKKFVLSMLLLLMPVLVNAQNKYIDILEDSRINLNARQKDFFNGCVSRYDRQSSPLKRKVNEYNKLIAQEIRKSNDKKLDKVLLLKLISEKKQVEAELEYVMLILDIEILSGFTEEQLSIVKKRHMGMGKGVREGGNHGSGSMHRRRRSR